MSTESYEAPERRAYPEDLTDEERKAIASLARLAKKWPDTLRLFAWSGSLTIEDLTASDKGADSEIRTIDNLPLSLGLIPCEGGDPYERR